MCLAERKIEHQMLKCQDTETLLNNVHENCGKSWRNARVIFTSGNISDKVWDYPANPNGARMLATFEKIFSWCCFGFEGERRRWIQKSPFECLNVIHSFMELFRYNLQIWIRNRQNGASGKSNCSEGRETLFAHVQKNLFDIFYCNRRK